MGAVKRDALVKWCHLIWTQVIFDPKPQKNMLGSLTLISRIILTSIEQYYARIFRIILKWMNDAF